MRIACAAGSFYPAEPDKLKNLIKKCFEHKLGPKEEGKPIIGGMVPHAGYVYSGPAAAWVYNQLKKTPKKTVVLIGPNHTGYGTAVSVSSDDAWQTPLGEIEVDTKMRDKLVKDCSEVIAEDLAHRFEHSLEVQLPFLQFIWKSNFKILPISLATHHLTILKKLGESLSKLDAIILASSDMSHYVPHERAMEQDHLVIEKILELNPEGMLNLVASKGITMCGAAPAAAMLWALKKRAKKAELLKYYTSGDTTGDNLAVVGYAAIAIR